TTRRRGGCGRGGHRGARRYGSVGTSREEAPSWVRCTVGEVRLVDVRDKALSVDEVLTAVSDPRAGGVAVFVGTVRDEDGGRAVETLEYESHPNVVSVMRELAAAVAAGPEVIAVAAVHRVGLLAIGDLAVVVA